MKQIQTDPKQDFFPPVFDEDVTPDEHSNLPPATLPTSVWRSARERLNWRSALEAAPTAAALGYCAAALGAHAEPALARARGGGKKGGK